MLDATYTFRDYPITFAGASIFVSGTALLREDPPFPDYGCYATEVEITDASGPEGEPILPRPGMDEAAALALTEDERVQQWFNDNVWEARND